MRPFINTLNVVLLARQWKESLRIPLIYTQSEWFLGTTIK